MPKYRLKRKPYQRVNKVGGSIQDVFKKALEKGTEDLNEESPDNIPTVNHGEAMEFGNSYNLFEGEDAIIVFKGLDDSKGKDWPTSYDVKIYESMDQLYRYGEIIFYDTIGLVELTNMYNTYDGEFIEVLLKGMYETDRLRKFTFSLHDCKVENLDGNDLIKRSRKVTFKLFEEPFFVNFHKQQYGDSYKENTAIEIVNNLLVKRIGANSIKCVKGDEDPIIPSFIIPNWTAKKTIQYLQNYVDGGPLKVFNISKDEKIITMVAPLTKFIDNKVYSQTLKIVPASTQFTKEALKLGPYEIWGINEMQEINFLRGETVMSFDYMYGDKNKKTEKIGNFIDFPKKGKDKYKYGEGEEEYQLQKRSYGSVLSGKYTEGLKKTKHLGNFTTHIKDDTSKIDHIYTLDVDPKPLIQTKLLNRFNQSYFDSFMLHTVLPHKMEINVGQIFDISIPSIMQPSNSDEAFMPDETLSGKWMLWKMEHVLKFVNVSDGTKKSGKIMYELHCYFVKTSYEKSYRAKKDKNV